MKLKISLWFTVPKLDFKPEERYFDFGFVNASMKKHIKDNPSINRWIIEIRPADEEESKSFYSIGNCTEIV